MKFLTTLIAAMSAPTTEASVRALLRLLVVLVVSVALFSLGFHYVMGLEGRDFSWWSSVYWTVVTMSTLGYGDITFQSDLGRMYSLVVLFAGAILILVLLPFTFIQVVYLPWRAATRQASAPRELPPKTTGHVILTELGPVTESVIDRLSAAGVPYALLVDDVDRGVSLHDAGYRVAVGALDDPDTYRAVRAEQAAMLFTATTDETNTNVVFTWREVTDRGLVVATATSADTVDILELVGCDRVLQLEEVLGQAFARRILAPTARTSVVATFEDLLIAEASASGTGFVGRSLAELDLRERFGISVVGSWDRGQLRLATPELVIEESSILLLVGTRDQIERYDDAVGLDPAHAVPAGADGPVVILGGGRVGRAAARALRESGTSCCIVERLPERVRGGLDYVVGDAADRDVLRRAGIEQAPAVIVTTRDDDTNIYLTLYCRRLRPDVEILGRVNSDRNLTTMHRAGADMVLSYASTGATEVWNLLRGDSTLLLAEGLLIFRAPVPPGLAGRLLQDTDITRQTGCTVIGLTQDGRTRTDIDPHSPLPHDAHLVMIGDDEAEERFLSRYVARDGTSLWRRVRGRTPLA
ncbi:MAG: NAD-binding protein [Actinomycetota bacterium]|nr:NAD-binding protein [Actinomycetota bacterium]